MVMMTYRYRLYPTGEQEQFLGHHFGCCRYVYNYFLDLKSTAWTERKEHISWLHCQAMLPKLKAENLWLKDINSQSLQCALQNLEGAYKRFYNKLGGYPRFHKKQGRQSFTVPQHFVIADNQLRIPKLKDSIKVKMHRPLPGTAKMLTIIREPSNKYYVSAVCEFGPAQFPPVEAQAGVDLNLRDYAVLSTGEKIEHPGWLKNSEQQLKRLQRRVSRKQKGSRNRDKLRIRVARLHEKISNQRKDFQHKLSYRLINENQVISLEGLRVRNMVRNRHLAKSISDAGWSEFARKIQYKADWYGRTVKVIDTFAPTSKKCSICGHINKELKLSQRVWVCRNCRVVHDRDHNAAVNIDQIGRDTPELTPVERRAAAISVFSIKQVRSKKQEAVPN